MEQDGGWRSLPMVEELTGDPARLEVIGRHSLQIEGHHGILEYSEERLRTAVEGGEINVFGRGLQLVNLTLRELAVRGVIERVEFVKRE